MRLSHNKKQWTSKQFQKLVNRTTKKSLNFKNKETKINFLTKEKN